MKKLSTRDFVLLALLVAILVVLGYWNIPMPGGLSITFNMIPLAIAAIVVGPEGGLIIGCAFGMISFAQCFGIFGSSAQGIALLSQGVSWVWLLIQRLVPRALDGLILGYLFRALRKRLNVYASCAVTGFAAAFLNTALFMSLIDVSAHRIHDRQNGRKDVYDLHRRDGGHQRRGGNAGFHRDHRRRGLRAVQGGLYPPGQVADWRVRTDDPYP